MKQVTRELKSLRVKMNMTQKEVAEKMGVSTQTYIEYENTKQISNFIR
jgi:DNA-binding XRE family transcriptional regulator